MVEYAPMNPEISPEIEPRLGNILPLLTVFSLEIIQMSSYGSTDIQEQIKCVTFITKQQNKSTVIRFSVVVLTPFQFVQL